MKYNLNDIVRIKSRKWYEENKNRNGYVYVQDYLFNIDMASYCGEKAVIIGIKNNYYIIDIDNNRWKWIDEMFETK